jgi:hypothetical protein
MHEVSGSGESDHAGSALRCYSPEQSLPSNLEAMHEAVRFCAVRGYGIRGECAREVRHPKSIIPIRAKDTLTIR